MAPDEKAASGEARAEKVPGLGGALTRHRVVRPAATEIPGSPRCQGYSLVSTRPPGESSGSYNVGHLRARVSTARRGNYGFSGPDLINLAIENLAPSCRKASKVELPGEKSSGQLTTGLGVLPVTRAYLWCKSQHRRPTTTRAPPGVLRFGRRDENLPPFSNYSRHQIKEEEEITVPVCV